MALSFSVQVMELPGTQAPTCSTACTNHPYGPQLAVLSFHPRCPMNSCDNNPYSHPTAVSLIRHCHLDGGEPCQINEVGCSVEENVSEQRTVQLALSPTVQVRNLPVMRHQTPINAHVKPLDGPPTTIFLVHQRFFAESCCRRLDGVELCQNDEVRCSVNKDVSKRRTVHLALPLIVQVLSLPEVRNHMHSKMRYEHPYGHQTAVPSNYPQFSESASLRHHSLEYSRLRPNDAVESDEVTSSMIWPDLKNNEICWSMSKHVRK